MAVIFMDGFDTYISGDWLKRWTTNGTGNSAVVISPIYANGPGGQGVLITGGNNPVPTKSFGANYAQGIIGFAFQVTGMASKVLFTVMDGVTEQCSIRINGSNVLTVNQGATVKATGSTALSASTWYYVEFKFTVHGSSGVAQVKLNGSAEIASTGSLDLTGTANNYWNGISLGGASGTGPSTLQLDDFYVIDPTTGSNTDFLGPVRCVPLAPAGPGNSASWSANGGTNYGCVSEPYQDGDLSFNQSSTADQIDTFVMQDLPASSGSVFAVQTLLTARQDAGAARTIAPVLRPVSTDRIGTTVALSTSYQILTEIYDLNPEDSAAWAPADVAGMEVGYKLIS